MPKIVLTKKRKIKYIQALDEEQIVKLKEQAKLRGIHLQELIRAVVIPEWQAHQK